LVDIFDYFNLLALAKFAFNAASGDCLIQNPKSNLDPLDTESNQNVQSNGLQKSCAFCYICAQGEQSDQYLNQYLSTSSRHTALRKYSP